MYLRPKVFVMLRNINHIRISRYKAFARIVRISFKCKYRKRTHINSVTVLKTVKVWILGGNSKYIRNTSQTARSGTHPLNIMVAPLNIDTVVLRQCVKNYIGSRTTVKNIAYNMQTTDCKRLDKRWNFHNKIIGLSEFDDCWNRFVIICFFVRAVICICVYKFVYRTAERLRQKFSDFCTCVFWCNNATYFYKAI